MQLFIFRSKVMKTSWGRAVPSSGSQAIQPVWLILTNFQLKKKIFQVFGDIVKKMILRLTQSSPAGAVTELINKNGVEWLNMFLPNKGFLTICYDKKKSSAIT